MIRGHPVGTACAGLDGVLLFSREAPQSYPADVRVSTRRLVVPAPAMHQRGGLLPQLNVLDHTVGKRGPAHVRHRPPTEPNAGPCCGRREPWPPRRRSPCAQPKRSARSWELPREGVRQLLVLPLQQRHDRHLRPLERLREVGIGIDKRQHARRLTDGDEEGRHRQSGRPLSGAVRAGRPQRDDASEPAPEPANGVTFGLRRGERVLVVDGHAGKATAAPGPSQRCFSGAAEAVPRGRTSPSIPPGCGRRCADRSESPRGRGNAGSPPGAGRGRTR